MSSKTVGNPEVFKDFTALQMFIEIRVKYLLQIISSIFQVASITLADVNDVHHLMFLKELNKLAESEGDVMDTLAAFDSLLSSNDWGSQWATQLRTSKCLAELMANTSASLRITSSKDLGSDVDEQRAAAIEFLRTKRVREQKQPNASNGKPGDNAKAKETNASGQS